MNKLCLLFSLLLVVAFGFVNGGKLEYDIDKSKEKIGIYELKNGNMSVKFTNWGATIMSLVIPDKHGKRGDIVLGYDTNDTTFFGSVVGRVANRIGGARFSLNGAQYKLPKNDGNNTLHGFPGEIRVTVRYLLRSDNRLRVTMKARALKKATPVNLAQHTYWNLGNHDSGDILSEEIQLFASRFTPVDEHLIPTGVLSTVRGTPYDFLKPRTIGSRIRELGKGYDINYAGVQFYSGNLIKREKGKGGFIYKPHAGLCLETQGFPDALNHQNFPSQIISPGKPYKHKMLFKFLTAKDNKSDKSSRLAEIDFD
ncbi:3-dehydroquinate synthase-like [Hibiscus syriacus]|uniref:3-dehydroquinate synthase-like n=1 Tax=Hibiscus syriacus TaxID=106335 RepID=A0A6A2ZSU0_HIBSY|nr:3-dehydroquinate synthase-like [Hibiscus syriacus]